MSRFRELLEHLRWERAHGGLGTFGLLRKAAMLVPHTLALALFNFGSALRKAAPAATPVPRDAEAVPLLTLHEIARGLPFSDATVASISFDGLELVEDAVAAMKEIQRVAQPNARVELTWRGRWAHPAQRRIVTPEMLDAFEGFRSVELDANRAILATAGAPPRLPHPRRIDLGCGAAKRDGYTGVDMAALPGVDIVRDVERLGLPFSNDTIEAVHAAHFLEHVRDVVFVMNEIHRVCCDGAEVEIVVPTLLGPWAAGDPTHVRLFNARTFGYFTSETRESYAGIRGRFALIEQTVSTSMRVRLRVVKSAGIAAS